MACGLARAGFCALRGARRAENAAGAGSDARLFDARRGFDVAAMAALSGTLRAGSWLVLLTPPFADWPTRADEDSLRWSDTPDPIVTPNFVHRCCRQFIADPEVLLWRQSDRPRFPLAAPRPDWHPADGRPQAEQAAILEQLIRLPPGIAAVTAERGRGKSALAGMLLRQLGGEAIVTAPTRSAVEVLASFAGRRCALWRPMRCWRRKKRRRG